MNKAQQRRLQTPPTSGNNGKGAPRSPGITVPTTVTPESIIGKQAVEIATLREALEKVGQMYTALRDEHAKCRR